LRSFPTRRSSDLDGTFDGAWRFYDHALDLIQAQAKPDYQFDPRSRPWFTQATAQAAPVVINPYVFYTTGQVGFTLAQRGAQGGAVIGMDVAIDDLNQQLNDLLITESA